VLEVAHFFFARVYVCVCVGNHGRTGEPPELSPNSAVRPSSAEFVFFRFREFLRTREFGRIPEFGRVRPHKLANSAEFIILQILRILLNSRVQN
jgi:hypothetical protein